MRSGCPAKYASHTPVLIDCTCSGLQHIAAIIGDPALGAAVNLTSSTVKEDLYELMAQRVQGMASRSTGVVMDRNMIKKVIMTIPYNATISTSAGYLLDNFRSVGGSYYATSDRNLTKPLQFKDIYNMAKMIHKSFFKRHHAVDDLVRYFSEIGHLLAVLQIPIR